jgi:hypothetical protein
MSKSDQILQSVEQLRADFKIFNDNILPAIELVIDDKLKPVIQKQIDLEKRITDLEKIVHNHIKHA